MRWTDDDARGNLDAGRGRGGRRAVGLLARLLRAAASGRGAARIAGRRRPRRQSDPLRAVARRLGPRPSRPPRLGARRAPLARAYTAPRGAVAGAAPAAEGG